MTIGLAFAGLAALYAAKKLSAVEPADLTGCDFIRHEKLGNESYSFWSCDQAGWLTAKATYSESKGRYSFPIEAATVGGSEEITDRVIIRNSLTHEGHQQRGLAKKVYEILRQSVCKKGKRLTSDDHRSTYAELLWRKQVERGAAVCEEGSGYALGPFKAGLPVPVNVSTDPQRRDFRWRCAHYITSCERPIEGLAGKPYVIRKGKRCIDAAR